MVDRKLQISVNIMVYIEKMVMNRRPTNMISSQGRHQYIILSRYYITYMLRYAVPNVRFDPINAFKFSMFLRKLATKL
jgi:hypothetical protein